MENKKIEKRSLPYMLSYILVPALIITICWLLWSTVFTKGNMAVVIGLCIPFLCILWWIFAGRLIYSQKQKKLVRELDLERVCAQSDISWTGKLCSSRRGTWSDSNPRFLEPLSVHNVLPASRIEKAWVDDGKGGVGFMEGSSRVSFLFSIDGVRIRVNTFTSNKRWRMDSEYILTGISKADLMVEVLETAKSRSN